MPYVLNGLDKDVHIQVFGKHFDFKPGQIKAFDNPQMVNKICASLGEEGLVEWPEDAMEWDRKGDEWAQLMASKKLEAKMNRFKKLEFIRYNEEVSLKKDLQGKNIQANPFVYSNRNLVMAYKEMEALKDLNRSHSFDYEAELKALVAKIDGGHTGPIAATVETPVVDPSGVKVTHKFVEKKS